MTAQRGIEVAERDHGAPTGGEVRAIHVYVGANLRTEVKVERGERAGWEQSSKVRQPAVHLVHG